MFRELNSHLFAFFKNHFSASRTNSSHVSNSGTVFNLAQSTVPYVSETSKKIGHIRKLIKKIGHFYTVSEKRLANLHFFSGKWPNIACIFSNLFLKIYHFTQKTTKLPF